MTVNRKLQYSKYTKGFFTRIPKTLVEALGWENGTNLKFGIDNGKLTITSEAVNPAKTAAPEKHTRPMTEDVV